MKLDFADGAEAEGLVRKCFHSKGRLSLSQSPNLFNFYQFLSASGDFKDVHFWAAKDDLSQMIGLTGFVNYDLNLRVEGMKSFYNSDSLVTRENQGRGIYLKLLDQQIDFFNSCACIPLSWGIEHIPGKLKGMKTYLEKKGDMEVRFLGHTRGFNILLSQDIDLSKSIFKKVYLRDFAVRRREEFLSNLANARSESYFYPRFDLSFFERVLKMDPEAYFVISGDADSRAGLLIVNMAPVRRYSESNSSKTLNTQHWSMYWSKDPQELENLFRFAYHEARQAKVDNAVVRDIPLGVAKIFPEIALEPRRVFAVTRQRDRNLFEGLEIKVKQIELDSLCV